MAFETQTINIKTKKVLGMSEFAVGTKVVFEPEKPLSKVLSIKAIADITSSESVDLDLALAGKTQVDVLYLSENNTLESVTGFAQWQTSTKVAGENLQAKVVVKEVNIEGESANELSVSILQNVSVEGIISQELNPVYNLSDDYVAKFENVKINQVFETGSGKFVVAENIDMPNAQKVLGVDAFFKVTNAYCGIDQVTIEGQMDVKILYALETGTAAINKTIDFRQEVACLGAISDYAAYASVDVSSINATLEVGEKTSLVLAVGATAMVDAYCLKEFEVATDLFSLSKQIDTTIDCINYLDYKTSKFYTDTVVCSVNLENQNIDELVAMINPAVEIAQYAISNNSVVVEGVVNATVIYRSDEETQSQSVACPFVSKVDTDLVGLLDKIDVECFISSAKIRSGKEVEAMIELTIGAINTSENYFEYAKNIVEVAPKDTNNSAITIYVTKENESLFDVAKALNVLPEVITNQNEVVDGKFASGARIFVYSPLNAEF